MGEITNRANPGHAGAAFQGMQISLQPGQLTAVTAVPGVQRRTGAFHDFFCFLKEDLKQLRVYLKSRFSVICGRRQRRFTETDFLVLDFLCLLLRLRLIIRLMQLRC